MPLPLLEQPLHKLPLPHKPLLTPLLVEQTPLLLPLWGKVLWV
jgi:hypothetical protein